ncbi:MAG TPA: bifunctional diaminohydroxyphosphoribosylaminopyrimidine deaminase/5-amino-6-(5-phosphoribosylamino)uracil reductase RibD [Candidatus Cloacimonetes bacterium]|nr:bifunctional diaminohydroxyphosphoribosylaminopyrimidine deaminase/5-amino-6-(5-phosphoribosylamino)uracil reductase RibD [Candidatus Cloacimonadota bacterium]
MDKYYIKVAMRNAEKSRGKCSPNPFVGATIVKDGKIVGEGNTQPYGQDHAEIVALKEAKDQAKGATLYVTMEPCCHYGKTPPCTDAIIKAGIKRVVVGILDPNPAVSGMGVQTLKDAGIEVSVGYSEDEINEQLEYYLCYITKKRPFVIWKTALTLDGRYAASDGSSKWISNESSRKYVHRLRSQVDVVLAGVNSVNMDNAMLNARGFRNINQPLRVVLDPTLQINLQSAIVKSAKDFPTLILHHSSDPETIYRLDDMGVEHLQIEGQDDVLDLDLVLDVIYERKLNSILLETGNRLSEAFWHQELVDKCFIFYGNKILGGDKSSLRNYDRGGIDKAVELSKIRFRRLKDNVMVVGYPQY